jgi:hypothetical protein
LCARAESLELRLLLSGLIVQGAGAGSLPLVRVFDADTGAEQSHFLAYSHSMRGGVRVAVGDVNNDGTQDIVTSPGPGAAPVVRIFDSASGSMIGQITLPSSWQHGGVWVAVGDVNGDGHADIVVSRGLGTPEIRVYDGSTDQLIQSLRADAGAPRGTWTSGAKIAVGDITGDGFGDIVATPVFGKSVVTAFDARTGAILQTFQGFNAPAAGRNSIALADVLGNRRLEIVAARASGTTAALNVFSTATDALVGRMIVPNAASASGVVLAAINLGGRGADELAVAPAGQRGIGAAITAPGPLSLSPTTIATPAIAYRLPLSARGSFLAGDSSVALSTPAVAVNNIEPPLSQDLPVLDRLAMFDRSTGQFVPVTANDPRLVGKDITVVTHGWAPGYIAWVNHEAIDNHHVLKWWETFPGQPGFDSAWVKQHPQAPDSAFLLQGISGGVFSDSTEISSTGLAQTIADRGLLGTPGPQDTNAVLLAYSWIDDSATPTWDSFHVSVPEEAYKSEALTTLNGERMAAALEQALGTSFTGKIQLVGHSHGSKVVSVASVALEQADLPVNEVTLLDSPESNATVLDDAANYNWYFLQNLKNINRSQPGSTFVSNIISEFDIAYSGITLSNGSGANLNQIVDVNLTPDIYLQADAGDRHTYAAAWYAGSGDPSVTFGAKVGQYWSPLLPANAGASNPVPTLAQYSQQDWDEFSQPTDLQYVLNPQSSGPPTEKITFANLSNPPVSLTQNGTIVSSDPIEFTAPWIGQSGISFDYQFTSFEPGDRLVIMNGSDPAFVMDASLVKNGLNHATISLYTLPFLSQSLTFVLTSETGNTTSKVTVSNFQTFEQPLT